MFISPSFAALFISFISFFENFKFIQQIAFLVMYFSTNEVYF